VRFINLHRITLLFWLVLILNTLYLPKLSAQDSLQTNGAGIMSFKNYLALVLENNPQYQAAQLKNIEARAVKLKALGAFDPKIQSSYTTKDFDNQIYYRYFSTELKYQSPLGIGLAAGYENTDGAYLNPEFTTDPLGLWNLGVEVNLLQGLIIDEKRLKLQQARIYADLAETERLLLSNDLIFQAASAYLHWQAFELNHQVFLENVDLAERYFENTRTSYERGEKTALDTIEAYVLWQDRMSDLNENQLLRIESQRNALIFLANIDSTQFIPYAPQKEQIVNSTTLLSPLQNVDSLPYVNQYTLQSDMMNRELLFNKQRMLPQLSFKYNPLLGTSQDDLTPIYSSNNYKVGIDFSIPILLRAERGDLLATEVKINQLQFKTDNTRNQLYNELQKLIQQIKVLENQIAITETIIENYSKLLKGENEKFLMGESSVFLLNKRQEKFIQSKLKLIKLKQKHQITQLKYYTLTNQIASILNL
jgi:outer membrane protein TolC